MTAAATTSIAIARRVLTTEAEALGVLAASLGHPFDAAIEALERASGRVVVTGMGKSGHIARKISATLASTGCPSFYVHPAEASHGDLGMVTRDDAVVALSNSGETPELGDIIAYCRRFDIPLVGITSGANSTLALASTVALVLPDHPEACPNRLAPTTSTTMMLALGDALAITLLERKGFTPADFRLFHPGGQLGRRLLRVSDLMHGGEALPLAAPAAPMSEVLLVMTKKSLGCAGIVDPDGRLVGIVTDGDLRRHMRGDLLSLSAAEVMNATPKTVPPTLLAAEALGIMNAKAITSLFAVDEAGHPVGVLHVHDCLRAGLA
ncbi:KpsF/GutQ family sugar-phosphate isomerase [Magnetospirillum fulvum]|uniref:Arabinose-5-phosphate isomerase n=1 Tax=Magnetospirillum fulvum TaxID=1082 RepID=A0A1H6I8M6_MAGFU|nr:KpsF/GutQ family sugar-phosphate isomerase [Magnetospirillum fulvum]SEH45073.1 arabinose-5-phosphate isomerase [Magnetospirillum fulvum]